MYMCLCTFLEIDVFEPDSILEPQGNEDAELTNMLLYHRSLLLSLRAYVCFHFLVRSDCQDLGKAFTSSFNPRHSRH